MRQLFYFSSLIFVLLACTNQNTKIKLAFTGAAGEILCDIPQSIWESGVDSVLLQQFQSHYPGLPQPEYLFNVLHFKPKKINKILRNHRNYLQVRIDPKQAEPVLRRIDEKNAKDQLFLEIVAPDQTSLLEYTKEVAGIVTNLFTEKELQRLMGRNAGNNAALNQKVQKKFGVELKAPVGFQLAKETAQFLWFKRERERTLSGKAHDITDGILIFTSPYRSEENIALDSLLAVHDQFMAKVPGPVDGSYMTMEREYYLSEKVVSLHNHFAKEIRGLWKLHGAFMGGAMVSLNIPDPNKGRIIHVLGFVYAPKFNKREYVKELEAVVYSIQY